MLVRELRAIFLLFLPLHFISTIDARRANMIRRSSPGSFSDPVGPIVLTVVLILALVGQFAIKIYGLM